MRNFRYFFALGTLNAVGIVIGMKKNSKNRDEEKKKEDRAYMADRRLIGFNTQGVQARIMLHTSTLRSSQEVNRWKKEIKDSNR